MIAGRKPCPLDDGWRIRTFSLLKALTRLGAPVDLLVLDETGEEAGHEVLQSLCRDVRVIPRRKAYSKTDLMRGLLFAKPFSVLNYAEPEFRRALDALLARHSYGYIQVEDVVMAQYVEGMKDARKVLDMHNIESDLLRRYADNTDNLLRRTYARNAAAKLERYEMRVAEAFDAVLVCSEEEKSTLQGRGMGTCVEVVPNGVDGAYYKTVVPSKGDALVFVGSMDYHANISGILFFVSEVLPILVKVRPKLKVYVVGKNPPEEITSLSSEAMVVTGAVDDVRPMLSKGAVSIVPLLVGGGTRLKILEAMAAGLPVVSTPLGAEGLSARDGREILIADSPEDFAGRVLHLLENAGERERLADSGRKFALANYDWRVIGCRLEGLVTELAGSDFGSRSRGDAE